MSIPRGKLIGIVKYCVFSEIGFVWGGEFHPGHQWSQRKFRPQHSWTPDAFFLSGEINRTSPVPDPAFSKSDPFVAGISQAPNLGMPWFRVILQ